MKQEICEELAEKNKYRATTISRTDEAFHLNRRRIEREKEDLEYYIQNGWVNSALEIIERLGREGWCMMLKEYSMSSAPTHTILQSWARAPSHENDQEFLNKWLEFEASVNYPKDDYENFVKNDKSRGELIYQNSTSIAARSEKWDKVKMLMAAGKEWGSSHIPFVKGALVEDDARCVEIMKVLLKMDEAKKWINQPIIWKRTALHIAIENGRDELIETLLAAGADINAPAQEGDTVLHWAMGQHGPDSYKLLVKKLLKMGANIDIKNDSGKTPKDAWLGRHAAMKWRFKGSKEMEWEKMRTDQEREWLKMGAANIGVDMKKKHKIIGVL